MNNPNKIAVAIALLCASASASISAETNPNPSWYVAPSVNRLDADERFGISKDGTGGGLRFGKPISQYWDVQWGATYAKVRKDGLRYQQETFGVDWLYLLSRENIRPFLLLGVGGQRDKLSTPFFTRERTSPNISGGAGLQLSLNEQWSLQADYRRVYGFLRNNEFGFNRSNNNYITVGLNYAFDRPRADVVRVEPSSPEPVRVVVVSPPPAAVPVTAPAVASTPPPAPPRFEKYTLSATELFGFGSAVLSMPQPKLDEIATALNGHAEVRTVVVTGYADRIGSAQYNQTLSERRADAVKAYLISKNVAANRLQATGRGETNPLVTCTNKNRPALIKCLEPNRRVEIEQITIERRVS